MSQRWDAQYRCGMPPWPRDELFACGERQFVKCYFRRHQRRARDRWERCKAHLSPPSASDCQGRPGQRGFRLEPEACLRKARLINSVSPGDNSLGPAADGGSDEEILFQPTCDFTMFAACFVLVHIRFIYGFDSKSKTYVTLFPSRFSQQS